MIYVVKNLCVEHGLRGVTKTSGGASQHQRERPAGWALGQLEMAALSEEQTPLSSLDQVGMWPKG